MEKLPFFIHGQPITDQTAEDNVEGEHRLLGDIPAVASVQDAGFDELSIHAALWPTDDGLRVVKSLNAYFRAGEVFATGWLERREGAWLQVSSSSPEFTCRKHRLAEVAALKVSPHGYADRGSFKV